MINRLDCYKILFEMKRQGINVEKQLKELSLASTVSKDIIKFINESRPLKVTEFYEELRKKNNIKSSKLYKNIMKEDLEPLEAVKTLSSLITQILIKAEKLELSDRITFYKDSKVQQLSETLSNYFREADVKSILEQISSIKHDIKILENKE